MKFSALIRPAVALALPFALAACGLTGTGTDGGGDLSSGVCTGVATVYAIAPGTYTISSATVTSDTCNSGVTAADLTGKMRLVANDTANGNIIVCGSGATSCTPNMANGVELGEGAVRCNAGTLAYSGPFSETGTQCSYTITRSSTITVTAKNTFTMDFTETDTAHMTCAVDQPDNCTTSFSITMAM